MFWEIKNRIEAELVHFIRDLDKLYSLNKISLLLSKSIKEFILRKGKRVRPTLFVIGYLGFAKRATSGLYRTALSLELLHDFMLVHDDIIDKSATRRGKPSMHEVLNKLLKGNKNHKFTGEDLAIVTGDIMYAMAVHTFLSIKTDKKNKEVALKKFCESAFYTGAGEFIELLYGLKSIDEMKKKDIYKIYDLKTSNYTFASPLSIGAILAGAPSKEVDILFKYGINLGRAFQIKDDILGLFGTKKKIGKSNLTDLQESKKTILIWYVYNNSNEKDRLTIKRIFTKNKVNKADLLKIRKITVSSGALDDVRNEINSLLKKAEYIIKSSRMAAKHKNSLSVYSKKLLTLD